VAKLLILVFMVALLLKLALVFNKSELLLNLDLQVEILLPTLIPKKRKWLLIYLPTCLPLPTIILEPIHLPKMIVKLLLPMLLIQQIRLPKMIVKLLPKPMRPFLTLHTLLLELIYLPKMTVKLLPKLMLPLLPFLTLLLEPIHLPKMIVK
jgi:hypothetical protein